MKKVLKNKAVKAVLAVIAVAAAVFFILNFVEITPAGKSEKKGYDFNGNLPYITLDIEFTELYTEKNYTKLDEGLKTGGVLPENGYFCDGEKINVSDGDTVLDALTEFCEAEGLPLDYESADKNAYGTAYIKGIGGLYEGDCTKNSGWTYEVNGKMPEVGMSEYELSDGDRVEISFVVF